MLDSYPLSREKHVKGARRMAREKSLQVLMAYYINNAVELDIDNERSNELSKTYGKSKPAIHTEFTKTSIEFLFEQIFFRQFNFGDELEITPDKLLTPVEIYELEADVPIVWKEEEIEFGKKLVRETLKSKEYIDELIDKYAQNWELERIAFIDRILMQLAACELMNFPEIPPKVSINEALDIAKTYSTDKSRIFINGVLDSPLEKIKEDGKLNKTGRGLIEN